MKVLLVEDDLMIANAIDRHLTAKAAVVDAVASLGDAHCALAGFTYDCIILDLNLPDGDGLTFLRQLRSSGRDVPILILTAREKTAERIMGLNDGADDYLAKPFDLEELYARLSAIVRRRTGRTGHQLTYGPIRLYPEKCAIWVDEAPVELPVSQYRLFHHLLTVDGRIQTKQQLIDALYSWDESVADNTIEVYISQLRKALWPDLIKTVRGVGYCVPTTPVLP